LYQKCSRSLLVRALLGDDILPEQNRGGLFSKSEKKEEEEFHALVRSSSSSIAINTRESIT
jgi:hypothetical protein